MRISIARSTRTIFRGVQKVGEIVPVDGSWQVVLNGNGRRAGLGAAHGWRAESITDLDRVLTDIEHGYRA